MATSSVMFCVSAFLAIVVLAIVTADHRSAPQRLVLAEKYGAAAMPLPFYRELMVTSPALTGNDVIILQNLLQRSIAIKPKITSEYDEQTEESVKAFQSAVSITSDGIVGPVTAQAILDNLSADGYKENGTTAGSLGYLYKIVLPV